MGVWEWCWRRGRRGGGVEKNRDPAVSHGVTSLEDNKNARFAIENMLRERQGGQV